MNTKEEFASYIQSQYTTPEGVLIKSGAEQIDRAARRFDAYEAAYAEAIRLVLSGDTWNRDGNKTLEEILSAPARALHLKQYVYGKIITRESAFGEDEPLVERMHTEIDGRIEAYRIMKENLKPDGSRDLDAEQYATDATPLLGKPDTP